MPILFSARMAEMRDKMPMSEKSSTPSMRNARQPSSRAAVFAGAMVFALGAGAFAASADNAKHYDTYAFIGDSIAAGHSLPEYVSAAGIGDRVFADYIVRFYLASILEVVARWLERDCAERKEEICRIILTCIDRARLLERMMESEAEASAAP